MGGGYIEPGDLDAALCDMIRHAVIDIAAWIDAQGGGHQGSFTLGDIDWDAPVALPDDFSSFIADWHRHATVNYRASHAIGFICGVAAGLDITPMTLVESFEDREVTRKALAYYAGVSDPDSRADAERALRMFDRMNADKSTARYVPPFPRLLTQDELMKAQGFPAKPKRAKRPTSKRRQKIRTIK